jgi:hypothetical protein
VCQYYEIFWTDVFAYSWDVEPLSNNRVVECIVVAIQRT